ncbi:MAG: rRNA maturation RNase YbeY [Clostridiales bacterium]|nr:rRNA maturation RNase YbeY [Clostridiales bacterium]
MMDILISNEQDNLELSELIEEYIKNAIETVLEIVGIKNEGEVSVTIVDNDRIRFLNKEFRKIDLSTDVLSFPQYDNLIDEFKNIKYLVMGDIVISADKVIEQAKDLGHSNEREFTYLIIHSMYHLLGYDHLNEDDKKIMRAKEKYALEKMQIFRG